MLTAENFVQCPCQLSRSLLPASLTIMCHVRSLAAAPMHNHIRIAIPSKQIHHTIHTVHPPKSFIIIVQCIEKPAWGRKHRRTVAWGGRQKICSTFGFKPYVIKLGSNIAQGSLHYAPVCSHAPLEFIREGC